MKHDCGTVSGATFKTTTGWKVLWVGAVLFIVLCRMYAEYIELEEHLVNDTEIVLFLGICTILLVKRNYKKTNKHTLVLYSFCLWHLVN